MYQNLDILREANPEFVLVLAGDHVYKMDYARMLAEHVGRGADLTVACIEVPLHEACNFGVMSVDAHACVIAFEEKPVRPTPCPDGPGRALASMGIYVFNMAFLGEHLVRDAANAASSHDFGKDMHASLVREHRVSGHRFADS